MARIRTVKPEFFQHEALFDAEKNSSLPLRIAFAGLWTVADKCGRFEWRPRQLKLNVLPYDELDFAEVLSALEKYNFLIRYEVDGKEYGCIPSWEKHQHINVREPDSTIPAPDFESDTAGKTPDEDGTCTGSVPAEAAGKGREGKGTGKGKEESHARDPLPDGLNFEAWERWEGYRKLIRKPLKPVSIPAAQQALAAFGSEQSAVVEQSVANGWQGLFALKLNGSTHGTTARKSRFDELHGS